MKPVTSDNFGYLIAYLLPGFALLWGLRPYVPELAPLLGGPPEAVPTVGGFLSTTVASVGAGLTLSTVRWMLVDPLHHATGVRPPAWDFFRLRGNADAFALVVEHYYRYYQFAANSAVALLVILAARRAAIGFVTGPFGWADLILPVLMAVLLIGSRDSLCRYYTRGGALLRAEPTSTPRRAKAPGARERDVDGGRERHGHGARDR